MTMVSAAATTTIKMSSWLQVVVAVDCVVLFFAMAFVIWQAWKALRRASETLDNVDRSLHSLAESMLSLATLQIRRQELDLAASQGQVIPVAMNVVIDGVEIFDANPQTAEIGFAVFTVRNVGGDAVFVLGVTRTAEDGMPPGQGRLVSQFEGRDVNLRLDPSDPPLDLQQVTVWYRDLRGRRWMRSLGDSQATQVAEAPAEVPAAVPAEVPAEVPAAASVPEAIPSPGETTALEPGDQEAVSAGTESQE